MRVSTHIVSAKLSAFPLLAHNAILRVETIGTGKTYPLCYVLSVPSFISSLIFNPTRIYKNTSRGKIRVTGFASRYFLGVHHAQKPRGFFMGRTLGSTTVRRFLECGNANLFRPAHQWFRIRRVGITFILGDSA